jgi:protein-S-isoprenylcysteine O-methyltransferase Ste14
MKTGSFIRLFLLVPGNFLALILTCLGVDILQTNLLGWFLLLFAVAYMAGGAIFLWPKNARSISRFDEAVRDEVGDRSFWLILPGFLTVFFGSPLEYIYLNSTERTSLASQIAAWALILSGVTLRIWTRLTLKGQYTGHVQVLKGQPLQTGGPYCYVRHPGYTAYLLICVGLAVGLGSFIGLASTFLILLPGLFFRMRVEEEMLTKQYGDEYLKYAVRTKRLVPGIW